MNSPAHDKLVPPIDAPHIEVKNVSFSQSSAQKHSNPARKIFDNISMTMPRGKITAIMGPSGSGKTTLLRLISGLIRPESGDILVDKQNFRHLSSKKLLLARRNMGLLCQSAALFTNLNVFENVAFPLREHTNLPESMLRDLVLMKLEAVGLRGAQQLMPAELSGGMARRVALARAIALDPQLIMYDEPFAGQDPISIGVLLKLIIGLNQVLGITSIIVSHDVQETASIADYMYIIANGEIIGIGTPEELLNSKSAQIQQFMQGLPDGAIPFHYPAKNYLEDLVL